MSALDDRDFASLLDELAERAAERAAPAPAMPIDILAVMGTGVRGGASAESGLGEAERHYLQSAEREAQEDLAVATLERIVVVVTPSTDPADIERELGLSAPGTDLDRLRRDFAFANHPDRVDPAIRDAAMVRMQIANRLIDDAKSR